MTTQPTLGLDVPPIEALPERIRNMHRMYGRLVGRRCGDCRHCIVVRLRRNYRKCELSTQTAGPGTDWRAKWPACGKWEERW